MKKNKLFDLAFYNDEIKILVGVDEVGRGPLAGPVVAAAVIFDKSTYIPGVDDSKKLSEKQRNSLSKLIKQEAVSFGYGVVKCKTIDRINILQATLKAMKSAVNKLSIKPNLILIDGNKTYNSPIPTKTIVKGDSKSFSIAAASILAKVKRDEMMKKAAISYPEYLWEKNKGYGTREHISAIKKFGFSSLHRKTFLRKILNNEVQEKLI